MSYITARYSCKCKKCAGQIVVGERIKWSPGVSQHVDCSKAASVVGLKPMYDRTMDALDDLDDKTWYKISLHNMPDIFLHCATCKESWTNHDPVTAKIAIQNSHVGHEVSFEWGGYKRRG